MLKDKKFIFAAWAGSDKNFASNQTWYIPFKNLFGDIITFDPQVEMDRHGQKGMNARFLDLVKKEKPDYIFFWLIYDEFFIDTLLEIRKISPKTRLINFYGDDDPLFDKFSIFYSLFIEYCFILERGMHKEYKKYGVENVFVTDGVNTDLFKPMEKEYKFDATFIGVPKSDRIDYLRHLIKNNINLRIFGGGWGSYPEFKEYYRGKLDSKDYVSVINNSKINISFTKNYDGRPHYKGRVAEVCACKSFVLTEHFSGYANLFEENKEIVMFKNKSEMLKKVNYYLKNEKKREKVSLAAFNRVKKSLSLNKQLAGIFNQIEKNGREKKANIPLKKRSVYYIELGDAFSKVEDLKKRLENFDYVGFKKKNILRSLYKDFMQSYAIEKTGKPISCCDYCFYSRGVGDFMSIISRQAFLKGDKETRSFLLVPEQLVIKKEYFLKEISLIRKFIHERDMHLLKEKDIAFVYMPLLRVRNKKRTKIDIGRDLFSPKFEIEIKSLVARKQIITSPYIYKLLFTIATYYPFIFPYFSERFSYSFNNVLKKIGLARIKK